MSEQQVLENSAKFPMIRVKYRRFREVPNFALTLSILVLGMRGAGKSSLLEVIGIRYKKIFDLFSSKDFEGLAWCKPEFTRIYKAKHGREPRILLFHGDGVEVSAPWDKKPFSELSLKLFEDYDIITTCPKFFYDEEEYFEALHFIIHLLWDERTYWTEPWFVMIREAANWLYARLKAVKDDKAAKAEFIKFLREARHSGLAVGVDTLRWTNIDKEIRDLCDWIFIKKLGNAGLPEDLHYLYRFYHPFAMMRLKKNVFVALSNSGAIGHGTFDYPVWHKTEKEPILKNLGVEIRLGEKAEGGPKYGKGDIEHEEFVSVYAELKNMNSAAQQLAVSVTTIRNHTLAHNKQVKRRGFCKRCKNAEGDYAEKIVMIGELGKPRH